MKLKALMLALFTAGIAVSIAVASSTAAVEKGKPGRRTPPTGTTSTGTSTTEGLRDHGKAGDHGTADDDTADDHGKSGDRRKAGDHGKAKGDEKQACRPARKVVLHGEFIAAGAGGFAMAVAHGNHGAKTFKGKQVTVLVDEKTRFQGRKHTLAELVAGDRLVVHAFACKVDAAAGSLLARKVGVKGAKGDEKDDDATTTGTTTTGTTTTAPTTGP